MIYEIKKGNHYSRHLPKVHFGINKLRYKIMFFDSCWFPLEKPDDYAINKACGWSMGWHHRNSVRVGWTPNPEEGKIDLFFYLYSEGHRIEQYFATVDVLREYFLEMDLSNDLFSIALIRKGITTTHSVHFKEPKWKWGFFLFPYIGGKLPAKKDTYIEMVRY